MVEWLWDFEEFAFFESGMHQTNNLSSIHPNSSVSQLRLQHCATSARFLILCFLSTGSLCNSDFKWIPKIIAEATGSETENSKPTEASSEESTLVPVMSAFVPLVLLLVAIGAYCIVDRQRKVARLAAVSLCFAATLA